MVSLTEVYKAQGNLKAITGTQGSFSNQENMSTLTGLNIASDEKEAFLKAVQGAGVDATPLQSDDGRLTGLQADGENALVTALSKLGGEQVRKIQATIPKSREVQLATLHR